MGTRPRERDGPGRALGPAKAPGTRSGATVLAQQHHRGRRLRWRMAHKQQMSIARIPCTIMKVTVVPCQCEHFGKICVVRHGRSIIHTWRRHLSYQFLDQIFMNALLAHTKTNSAANCTWSTNFQCQSMISFRSRVRSYSALCVTFKAQFTSHCHSARQEE